MNEMKPEDVMRAMECCIVENDKDDCLGCPYSGKRHRGEMCVNHLLEDAIALLRENRSQISVLKKLLDRCETQFAEKDAEIDRLKKYTDNFKMVMKSRRR